MGKNRSIVAPQADAPLHKIEIRVDGLLWCRLNAIALARPLTVEEALAHITAWFEAGDLRPGRSCKWCGLEVTYLADSIPIYLD